MVRAYASVVQNVGKFDLALSEGELAVEQLFRQFFEAESSIDVVRRSEPLGYDGPLWTQLCGIGAPAMGARSSIGTSAPSQASESATYGQLVVAAQALGRSLAPVPLIEHWVALFALGDRAPVALIAELIAELIDGARIATIALTPLDASGWWRFVPAGAVADVIVGHDANGGTLLVTGQAPHATAPNHACSPIADRDASDGTWVELDVAWSAVIARWNVLTAASLVGIAERSLELAVEYATTRHQFGVPIGSFQAVQHSLADLPGRIEGARLLTHKAASVSERGNGNQLARMAFLAASEAAAIVTDRALHVHGGYGYAEEGDLQLFYRRARGWPLVAGPIAVGYQTLADDIFGPSPQPRMVLA